MYRWIQQFGSPKYFYDISLVVSKWIGVICLICFIAGLYGGLVIAPPDYQQGDSYRIIYIHVPASWMSLFVYMILAISGAITLIWRIKIADFVARSSAVIGASFTFLALATGAIWGKPMWGTYWVWDARLTSELILLFLYLGYIALQSTFEDRRVGARAGAILALIGVINIPIIHYSVEWWSTLHQPASIKISGESSIHSSMLMPLLLMFFVMILYCALIFLMKYKTEIIRIKKKNLKRI